MNLEALIETQKGLDDHIELTHPRTSTRERLAQKVLAFQVELGELANELPEVFKFWSNKKNCNVKALKEYVDGLHFLLSIGLELEIKNMKVIPLDKEFNNLLDAFRHCFNSADNLDFALFESFLNHFKVERTFLYLLSVYMELGQMIGFSSEEIEQAYYEKNATNHVRQENGY